MGLAIASRRFKRKSCPSVTSGTQGSATRVSSSSNTRATSSTSRLINSAEEIANFPLASAPRKWFVRIHLWEDYPIRTCTDRRTFTSFFSFYNIFFTTCNPNTYQAFINILSMKKETNCEYFELTSKKSNQKLSSYIRCNYQMNLFSLYSILPNKRLTECANM